MIGNDGRVVAVREEALADVSTAIFVDLPPGAYMRVLVLVCVCVCAYMCVFCCRAVRSAHYCILFDFCLVLFCLVVSCVFCALPAEEDEGSLFEERDPLKRLLHRVVFAAHDFAHHAVDIASHLVAPAPPPASRSAAAAAAAADSDDAVVQDYFNTNKMVVAVTARGRVVAFLSETGRVVWAHSPVASARIASASLLELRNAAHMHALVALVASTHGAFRWWWWW